MNWILIILLPFVTGCVGVLSSDSIGYMANGVAQSFDPTINRGFNSPEEVYRSHKVAGIAGDLGPSQYGMQSDQMRYYKWRQKNPNGERWQYEMYYDPVAREWRGYRSEIEYLNGIK